MKVATGAPAYLHRIIEPWKSPGLKGAGKIIGPTSVVGRLGEIIEHSGSLETSHDRDHTTTSLCFSHWLFSP